VTSSGTDFFVTHGDGDLSGSHNISSDGSAATHFTSSLTSIAASALLVAPNLDLHLKAGANVAVDSGLDLSASFEIDIDFHGRPAGASWDRGADERDATTAVELVSFEATPLDAAVELTWETASELNNLGFQVYRSRAYDGDYERVSPQAIPGLGSSPAGASYRYVDPGLGNGVTYFYKLEDIETTGARTFHGPVSAAPASGPEATGSSSSANTPSVVYANPEASALRVVRRSRRELVLELSTEGFSAEQQKDGSVRLVIPGFEELEENAGPDLPVKRTWIDAIAGRKVKIRSVREHEVETFAGLRPSNAEIAELVALPDGSVRLRRKARQRGRRASPRLTPESAARVVSVGFQGDGKKALVELAPLRWDEASGQLLLARRLVVRVSFQERDPAERSTDGAGRGRRYVRPRSHERQRLLARLGTTEPGLHAVRFEHLHRFRRGIPTRSLRLSRQGETVAFRVEPDPSVFEPGSVLYFVGAGAAANPFGDEAVYEIALGNDGAMMTRLSAKPSGTTASIYWHRQQWQQERFYQAALVEAPDPWLWDVVFAPGTKRFPLDVSALAPSTEPATLDVWLQGASDFDADPDHHVRISVNGTLVHELSWDGKQPRHVSAALPPGLLHDADNTVEIDNVGDTGADYSMVLLDRYALTYPRFATADDGRLESKWSTSGAAEVSGLAPGAHVVDVTDTTPRWLVDTQVSSEGVLRFHAEAGRDYLTVRPDAVYVPSVTRPRAGRLKNRLNHADYVVIGPETFLDVARPLLKLRRREGLDVLAVSLDDIYSEFGFGEATPDAIKDFLSYAYHYWKQPPRYVLLLGDATYDFHDALQTGVENRVPPRIIKTRYLWTASDPSYAAVNGDDLLPDLAIGRLPAASPDELRVMVDKILVYERSAVSFASSPMVLVADNPDHAGNFEADADELASGILSAYDPHEIYSSRLGTAATRNAIVERFDLGASLVSYIGHGGIQLWADENFFNGHDVDSLATQSRQPLLLTMNCLNGFFHFPYFDSLAEALVKADGKGAIAAFSPSGLSLNTPARLYHQALLQSLVDGRHPRLGDAILAAQSAYADTGALPELLAIYHLLGDPALRLRNK
jgi:hypothetical protein